MWIANNNYLIAELLLIRVVYVIKHVERKLMEHSFKS